LIPGDLIAQMLESLDSWKVVVYFVEAGVFSYMGHDCSLCGVCDDVEEGC